MKICGNSAYKTIKLKLNHSKRVFKSITTTKTYSFLSKIKKIGDKYIIKNNNVIWSTVKKKLFKNNVSCKKKSCISALKKLNNFQKSIIHNEKNKKVFFALFKIALFSSSLVNLIKIIHVLSKQSQYDIDNINNYINSHQGYDLPQDEHNLQDLEVSTTSNIHDHQYDIHNLKDLEVSTIDDAHNLFFDSDGDFNYKELLDLEDGFLDYIMPDSNEYQKNLFLFSYTLYNTVITGFSAAMLAIEMKNMIIKQ